METTDYTNAVIALAEQYVEDPILQTRFASPTYHHIETGTPKPNRAFTCEPEQAWDVYFDARTLGADYNATWGKGTIGWKPTQILVEVGRRGTVLSVERHATVAPVAQQIATLTAPKASYTTSHEGLDQETGEHAAIGGRT